MMDSKLFSKHQEPASIQRISEFKKIFFEIAPISYQKHVSDPRMALLQNALICFKMDVSPRQQELT
jgi:hypothetical protein